MLNKDKIEKSLLLGIVRDRSWKTLILNNITIDYFTLANHKLFKYIKGYADAGNYPDLRIIANEYEIDEVDMAEFLEIRDLDGLCKVLRDDYLKEQLIYNVSKLNEYNEELESDPAKYIDRLGVTYETVKKLSYHNKSVSLFENIEEILTIDSSNVIPTGFKELDEKLTGWKRGEELVILVGRTGQGKSWLGLKFAMAGAIHGERVGIYSGEMSTQQLQERILCCAKQAYTATKEEALQFIREKDIDIKVLTQRELRRRANINDIEEFIIRDNLSMLIIDQLSLMEDVTSKPGTPLRQQFGNISMDLFTMTSKYNIPIILLVQSNRAGSDSKDGPQLENIAESDAVAQNATRVITMKNENGVLTLNIQKNRYGDSRLIQKYDVDYGINKYKPIVDYASQVATPARRGGGSGGAFRSGRTF